MMKKGKNLWSDFGNDFEPVKKLPSFQEIVNPLQNNIKKKEELIEKIIQDQGINGFDLSTGKKISNTKEPIEDDNENGSYEDKMQLNSAYMKQYDEAQKEENLKKENLKDSDSEKEDSRIKNLNKKSKKESIILKSRRKKSEPYIRKTFQEKDKTIQESRIMEIKELERKPEDFLKQFPEPDDNPPPIIKKNSKKSSALITPPEPLSKKKFYEEIQKTSVSNNNNLNVNQEFMQIMNIQSRANIHSSIIHKFLKTEAPKSNITSTFSINNSTISIPTRTRSEEDMYLRTPMEGVSYERPCCRGLECQGRFIPGAEKKTLVEFLTLEERAQALEGKLPKPKMCVMCSRYLIGYHHIQQRSDLEHVKTNWLIQNYKNEVDIPGEYILEECIMGSSTNPYGLFYPVVIHIKNYYKQEREGDMYYYRQIGYKYPKTQVFQ
jgi:hypothetical protein